MPPSAEMIVLETTKSPELRAEFDRIRQATGLGQEPRFPRQVSDKLATLITTRTYAPSVLQLCHLIGIARRLERSVEVDAAARSRHAVIRHQGDDRVRGDFRDGGNAGSAGAIDPVHGGVCVPDRPQNAPAPRWGPAVSA